MFVDKILGIYRNGRVVLDERPDWPDGQRIAVLAHLDGEPIGTELPRVGLPDGRTVPFNGSKEHSKLLAEQMDRHDFPEPTEEEYADFKRALDDMNRLYGDALKRPVE